jgi:hypothetical protein
MARSAAGADDAGGGVEKMNGVIVVQPELITSDLLIDLHIGWYYKYNPDRKPEKGTVMPVCQLMKIKKDTVMGKRCEVVILGKFHSVEVHQNQLAPCNLIRPAEAENFNKRFPVEPEQWKIWSQAW